MFKLIVISIVLVLIAVALLGVRIYFFKNKRFPSLHIGEQKALKDKGIDCATSQDRQAQKK